jgi:phage terminase small subunit
MPPAALTPKQQEFVTQYLLDLNASAAATRAGYSAKTAQEQASRLLSNVMIQAAIAQAQAARAQRTQVDADRVLLELARLGFANLQHLYNDSGALLPPHQWPADAAAAVVSLSSHDLFQVVDGERRLVGYARTVKLADKSKALAMLGRHLGLLDAHAQPHEISALLRSVLLEMHDHSQPKDVTPTADWAPLPPGPRTDVPPGPADTPSPGLLPAPPAPDEEEADAAAPPAPDPMDAALYLVLRGVHPQVRVRLAQLAQRQNLFPEELLGRIVTQWVEAHGG